MTITSALRTPIFLLAFVAATVFATAASDGYRVHIDTRTVINDQLSVRISIPKVDADTATFIFPATVPGTYEPHLWWRFVSNFAAVDTNGSSLPIRRTVDSQFVIENARALRSVSYTLDDSFDDTNDSVSVFHPAGTSFQGDSVFVFNHGGIVGYIEGMQNRPYSVSLYKKPGLFTATALNIRRVDSTTDIYQADSYDALVDGPALICIPDTATFEVEGVHVLVALFHGKNKSIASAYATALKKVTSSIASFLPHMPVLKYAFLLYLWDGDTTEVNNARYAQGALEHSYSSLYFWRYTSRPMGLNEVAAHEFLHILVPLNLHSEEIEPFNFRNPLMSRHLWLYEGVTEYFAHQALMRGDTASERAFVSSIASGASISFSALPEKFSLTEFSKNVLTPENQNIYPLIYQYGPLNALCLDILIREETGGRQGLLEIVYALMFKFGPSHPFKDEEFFDHIESVTSKKVRDYCDRYILGTERVPLAEYLPKVGMVFVDSMPKEQLSYGIDVGVPGSGQDKILIGPKDANPLDVENGDELIKIDSSVVSVQNPQAMSRLFRVTDTPITITVIRDGDQIELTGRPVMTTVMQRNVVLPAKDVTDDIKAFRRLVFYGRTD